MTSPDQPRGQPPDLLRETGARIETLLDASASGGAVARERAEELVRLVADLYGEGLERLLDIMFDLGRLDDSALSALADDELVSSLLLVHGLHPYDVTTRVQNALESVRPYLGTHGGDVELLEVTADSVVRLRLLGSCDGCPSSAVTLSLAVESAVEEAAPEITGIEVETGEDDTGITGPLIPVESLRARLEPAAPDLGGGWEPAPLLAELGPGEVGGFVVGDIAVLACRIQNDLFAFRDHCPRCASSMAGARLERRLGHTAADAVLLCPRCRSHYDARRAGISLETDGEYLSPLPLLVRGGVPTVAVPAGAS
jgi:Fe-S cluster biogenesis protein NfuA